VLEKDESYDSRVRLDNLLNSIDLEPVDEWFYKLTGRGYPKEMGNPECYGFWERFPPQYWLRGCLNSIILLEGLGIVVWFLLRETSHKFREFARELVNLIKDCS
jgi:hypothetical protein